MDIEDRQERMFVEIQTMNEMFKDSFGHIISQLTKLNENIEDLTGIFTRKESRDTVESED